MRAAPRLGLGHLVVFVVVAVILNAQFTWWVVHNLRESDDRLEMEKTLIVTEAERAALELQLRAELAARSLLTGPPGVIPSAAPPFTEVRVVDRESGVKNGWVSEDERIALVWPFARGRVVVAELDPLAPHRWLAEIAPALHLVARDAPQQRNELPRVGLPTPFERLTVAPDGTRWAEQLASSRRRVVLVVVEGVFFIAALISAVALIWLVLRQEGARERQHQNFVSAVTHELKTPIAGIRLALETVLSGRVDDAGRAKFLGNALADAERLSDLVEKILEVTRYADGAHRLRIEQHDLSQLAEEEIARAERRAVARGITLEAEVEPFVQAPFDPEAISIVLSNLLENALKYAQGEPPRVSCSVRVERGEAVIEVRDNGVGIESSELQAIFAPFYRSGDEVTRRTPGTGIGLFVAHEIVVAHGGKLSASSEGRGKGSVFRLTLPGATVLPEDELSEYDVENETR